MFRRSALTPEEQEVQRLLKLADEDTVAKAISELLPNGDFPLVTIPFKEVIAFLKEASKNLEDPKKQNVAEKYLEVFEKFQTYVPTDRLDDSDIEIQNFFIEEQDLISELNQLISKVYMDNRGQDRPRTTFLERHPDLEVILVVLTLLAIPTVFAASVFFAYQKFFAPTDAEKLAEAKERFRQNCNVENIPNKPNAFLVTTAGNNPNHYEITISNGDLQAQALPSGKTYEISTEYFEGKSDLGSKPQLACNNGQPETNGTAADEPIVGVVTANGTNIFFGSIPEADATKPRYSFSATASTLGIEPSTSHTSGMTLDAA